MDPSLWKWVSSHADGLDAFCARRAGLETASGARRDNPPDVVHSLGISGIFIADGNTSVAADSLPELEVLYLVTTPDQASLEHARRAIWNVEERVKAGNRLKVPLNRAGGRGKTDPVGNRKVVVRAMRYSGTITLRSTTPLRGRFLSPASPLEKNAGADRFIARAYPGKVKQWTRRFTGAAAKAV